MPRFHLRGGVGATTQVINKARMSSPHPLPYALISLSVKRGCREAHTGEGTKGAQHRWGAWEPLTTMMGRIVRT